MRNVTFLRYEMKTGNGGMARFLAYLVQLSSPRIWLGPLCMSLFVLDTMSLLEVRWLMLNCYDLIS